LDVKGSLKAFVINRLNQATRWCLKAIERR
jgi:hypothetical protein